MSTATPRAFPVPALLLGLTLGLPWVLACGGEPPAAVPELRPVRYQRVTAGEGEIRRTLAGVARSGLEASLSFRVAGTVDRVKVKVGAAVRRGQVLARLDPTDYELRVQQAEANMAQGEAALRKAEADYERVRALYENNNAAKSELDAARAAAESAQAQVEAGAKQLQQARQQLAYTVLSAPQAGTIAAVEVEVNESVPAGREVFLLTAGARPEVVVAVPEVLIARVEEGQGVTVALDALPDRLFPATVSEVGVAVTGTASTFDVTARLDETDPRVRSGMAAEVTFQFRDGDGGAGLAVPTVAVGEDRQGRFVFVLEPGPAGEGTVRRRAVEVGRLGEEIEILAGLSEGELVVTAGVRRLADGMRVKVLERPATLGGGA